MVPAPGGVMRKGLLAGLIVIVAAIATWWFLRAPDDLARASSTPAAEKSDALARRADGKWVVSKSPLAAPPPTGSLKLRGRVLGADGPVAGAHVTATAGDGADLLSNRMC